MAKYFEIVSQAHHFQYVYPAQAASSYLALFSHVVNTKCPPVDLPWIPRDTWRRAIDSTDPAQFCLYSTLKTSLLENFSGFSYRVVRLRLRPWAWLRHRRTLGFRVQTEVKHGTFRLLTRPQNTEPVYVWYLNLEESVVHYNKAGQ